ncbi:MAG: HNH endonuclease signature motif containing protein [Isosphaeraceae bacterium]
MPQLGKRKRMLRGDSECAYCGKVPATTVDHVVPKCLFESPLPTNMITVPACLSCNEAKSKLDSFLRDFLVCEEGAPPHRVADSLRTGPYQRAVRRKQSALWKEIDAGNFEKTSVHFNGIDLGTVLQIPFGKGPLKNSITYIVRGLHYKLLNKRLPDDHLFLVGGIGNSDSCIRMLRQMQRMGSVGIAAIGKPNFDVFSSFCASWYTAEDRVYAASIWGLAFYDRIHIGCITVAESKQGEINPYYFERY